MLLSHSILSLFLSFICIMFPVSSFIVPEMFKRLVGLVMSIKHIPFSLVLKPKVTFAYNLDCSLQRNRAATPSSYPQVQAPIVDNPALWERLDTDVLFFAFYYQQVCSALSVSTSLLFKHMSLSIVSIVTGLKQMYIYTCLGW
jgi:hypothetical protein